jgi:hypothetical protein
MLLSTPYEDVYVATAAVDPARSQRGLHLKDLQAIAAKLGTRLEQRRRSAYDLDVDTGILKVTRDRPYWSHFVVLFRGIVLDPDGGAVYEDLDDYLAQPAHTGARPRTLLVKD